MTRRSQIERYVAEYLDVLGLRQWQVRVRLSRTEDPDDPNSYARVWPHPRYMSLRLVVYPHFWTQDEEAQERTILHELAHAVTEPLQEMINRAGGGKASEDAIEECVERATEHIAAIVWELCHGRNQAVVTDDCTDVA